MNFLINRNISNILRENISLIVIAIISILLAIYEPLIFQVDNLSNIAKQTSLIAIFALAQSIVLIIKGLDLSQGGIITLVSVIVALLSSVIGLTSAIFIGVLLGSFLGLINGVIISKLNVSPFVVTLGMGFLFQGIALVLSKGQPVYKVSENFSFLGWHKLFGIPIIVYILLFISIVLYTYMSKTIYGLYLYAIGSNEKAAYLSGIKVRKHKIIGYFICGLITGIGAIVLASRINSGHPVEGINTALNSVAAAVIGGVSLFGGKGKVIGVILGSLLLAFISNSLNILNVSSYYQQIMVGVIIIFAIIIDKIKTFNYDE